MELPQKGNIFPILLTLITLSFYCHINVMFLFWILLGSMLWNALQMCFVKCWINALFCLIALLLCNTGLASSTWMNIDKIICTALTFSVRFFLIVTNAWKKYIIGNDDKVFCYQNSIGDVLTGSCGCCFSLLDLEWIACIYGSGTWGHIDVMAALLLW